MNLRCLPLVLALTTVAPLAVHAQRMPNPQEMPAPDLKKIPPSKMGTTIRGTITVKDPQQMRFPMVGKTLYPCPVPVMWSVAS